MTILIIGANGFIGKAATNFFKEKNYIVSTCSTSGICDFVVDKNNPEYSEIFKANHFDVCINAAGSPGVGFSLNNSAEDFTMNALAVHKLLEAVKEHQPKCKLIIFSSAAVYGNPKELPIKETTLPQPISPYGYNKLTAETICKMYSSCFNLHISVFRLFSAYGPGIKKMLFWDLYNKINDCVSDEIQLYGTGRETRDFIFIDDVVKAIESVMLNQDTIFEIYNLASGTQTTIKDAVDVFLEVLDKKRTIVFNNEEREGDPKFWHADIDKLKQLNRNQNINLKQGLSKYIEWLKQDE